ncbi:MAG: hypothetical protein AAFP69_09440 [Planctomycetota bacterium]
MAPKETALPNVQRPHTVMVHGLGSGPLWMLGLKIRLRNRGHWIDSFGYNSYVGGLQRHRDRFIDHLQRVAEDQNISAAKPLNLVAHSMGTIVTRMALLDQRTSDISLGRIVLLTPPNRPIDCHDWVGPLVRPICPAVGQLATHPDSFVNQIPRSAPGGDANRVAIISAHYDILVARNSTPLDVDCPSIHLPLTHSGMLFSRSVADHVDQFLRTGEFASSA